MVGKANPASVPRSERIVRHATCGAGDALRQCVRVTAPRVGNLWNVGGVTSSTITELTPAVGVIIKKLSPTECFVQFHGPVQLGLYSGLTPGQRYVVGTDGQPATIGDINYPLLGVGLFQQIGIATSDDELLVHPVGVGTGLSGRGEPGPPGFDGEDGEDGSPGPPGAAGSSGVDGLRGPPGSDGEDGEDGPPGPPGTSGPPGATGSAGAAGPQGLAGPPGADGEDGDDGAPGVPGAPGPQGRDGALFGNVDGGVPSSVYGGTFVIDGGGP